MKARLFVVHDIRSSIAYAVSLKLLYLIVSSELVRHMKKQLLSLLLMAPLLSVAQSHLGVFEKSCNVGAVLQPGATQYDAAEQSYKLTGAGANIWFTKDEFHYAYQRCEGDFILQASAKWLSVGGDPHRKMGWMVRTSLDTNAAMVGAAIHGDGLAAIQYRKKQGAHIEEVKSPVFMPDIVQLERRGRSFFMSVAQYGKPFWSVELPDFDFPGELFTGLFVCAHDKNATAQAQFDNVRIVLPPKAGFTPYRDYLGSHIEILDVHTGQREILFTAPNSLQAPNWTADGKALLYNSEGLIYRFDLQSRQTSTLPTDFVQHNNNDHVISFDGKMLGLSSASGKAEFGSLVYTVPITGGTPRLITPMGPSYLHGWSPDGRWLTYTGLRNGDYDIYKIPATGGKEIQLTQTSGLDDGSEYSPDGKYIYFNSVRSGNMQIWRMSPDGKHPQRLTFDEYQNWFPHLSPDGQWMVFLSYMPEVKADDHPFYKHVYLRKMPADGSRPPEVIAYVYGGQGSINTPSWSPDGRYVAFVSNTGMEDPLFRRLREMEDFVRSQNMQGVADIYLDNAYLIQPFGAPVTGREAINKYWLNIPDPVNWKLTTFVSSANVADIYKHPRYQALKNKPPGWEQYNLALDGVMYQLGESSLSYQWQGQAVTSVVDYILVWQKQSNGQWKILVDTYATQE